MLLNFWYACEESALVTQAPRKVRLLGRDIVLYRTPEGKVAALRDLCLHRGGALSMGSVEGACIRCPYHGWVFRDDGTCAEIPANGPTHRIPKKATVESYPVQERYGFVWLFAGDLPEKDRPPIPVIEEYGQPGWRSIHGEFRWKAHYGRVVENGVDIAHAPFVHMNSFGNREEPEVHDYEVEADDFSAIATTVLKAPRPKGLWALLRKERAPVRVRVGFHMPNITRLELNFGNWKTVLIDSNVPADEHTTVTKYLQMRNFFTGAWADRDARRRLHKIFEEDVKIVEAVRPELLPYDLGEELHLRSDALGITFRKLRKRYLDRGWGVVSEAEEARRIAGPLAQLARRSS